MRQKEENPMGEELHPIPSLGIRPSSHPIRSPGKDVFFFDKRIPLYFFQLKGQTGFRIRHFEDSVFYTMAEYITKFCKLFFSE